MGLGAASGRAHPSRGWCLVPVAAVTRVSPSRRGGLRPLILTPGGPDDPRLARDRGAGWPLDVPQGLCGVQGERPGPWSGCRRSLSHGVCTAGPPTAPSAPQTPEVPRRARDCAPHFSRIFSTLESNSVLLNVQTNPPHSEKQFLSD